MNDMRSPENLGPKYSDVYSLFPGITDDQSKLPKTNELVESVEKVTLDKEALISLLGGISSSSQNRILGSGKSAVGILLADQNRVLRIEKVNPLGREATVNFLSSFSGRGGVGASEAVAETLSADYESKSEKQMQSALKERIAAHRYLHSLNPKLIADVKKIYSMTTEAGIEVIVAIETEFVPGKPLIQISRDENQTEVDDQTKKDFAGFGFATGDFNLQNVLVTDDGGPKAIEARYYPPELPFRD